MTPWLNDLGCHIYFDRITPIDEHGQDASDPTYRYWCAGCGRDQDEYEHLADCVSDARRHIEEKPRMTEWSNEQGCEIFFEELVAIDEHGNRTAGSTFSWWCRCGLNRDEYERLGDCVQAARTHIEEEHPTP